MNPARTYLVPSVLLALVVHGVVVVVLAMNWNQKPPIRIAKAQQYYIDAALVAHNPYTIKEQEQTRAVANKRARQQHLARVRQEAEQRTQAAAKKREQARRAELARQRAEKEDQARLIQQQAKQHEAQEAAQKAAAQKATAQQVKEKDLAQAVIGEQSARKAVTDDEKALAYVAQIKRVIIQNWSRPPSARNGMQALLKVHLVPDGEVVSVTVVKSSGNAAFDRSAVLAVQKAEHFDVPSNSRLFERNFRQFEVLFRPEDLRL